MIARNRLLPALVTLFALALLPAGAAVAQVKVTAATPSSTTQGTISLNVVVAGSGFDNTAKVQFLVAGTADNGGVLVRSVTFQNSKQVTATIDVADTATVAKYDIVVTLDGGRKGKGTTLFGVIAKANDPCVTASGFPAFAYIKGSGPTQQVLVSDETGNCSRALFQVSDGYSAAPSLSFSFPVDGTSNRGRVVWLEGSQVVGGDFTVSGSDVTLDARRVFVTGVDCCALALSPAGDHVYVSTGGGTLSKVTTASPTERVVVKTLEDDGWFQDVAINGDESALYVDERRAVGTQPGRRELVRIDLGTLASTILVFDNPSQYWPAADPASNRIVFTQYLAGSNNCYQLQVADGTTGATTSFGQPRYGTGATWVNGMILSNGYSAPSRRNQCSQTGSIVRVDPTTSSETALVTGFAPDGR